MDCKCQKDLDGIYPVRLLLSGFLSDFVETILMVCMRCPGMLHYIKICILMAVSCTGVKYQSSSYGNLLWHCMVTSWGAMVTSQGAMVTSQGAMVTSHHHLYHHLYLYCIIFMVTYLQYMVTYHHSMVTYLQYMVAYHQHMVTSQVSIWLPNLALLLPLTTQ